MGSRPTIALFASVACLLALTGCGDGGRDAASEVSVAETTTTEGADGPTTTGAPAPTTTEPSTSGPKATEPPSPVTTEPAPPPAASCS